MRWQIFLFLIPFLLSTACAAEKGEVEATTMDEIAEREAIFAQVKTALDKKDFAALNAQAEEYRSRRSRTPSGTWKLTFFYHGVSGHMPTENPDAKCPRGNRKLIDEWIAFDPKRPAPYIAKAWMERSHGGCLRGSAFASQTSPEAMAAYLHQVAMARDILEKHRDIASTDPQYYGEMGRIYRAQGRPGQEMEKLLAEAAEREPYYYDTYFSAAQYYLPQWNGIPGDLDRLARFAAEQTPDEGKGAYVRVFWSLEDCNCFKQGEIDWPTMKASMEDVAEEYPSDWNFANFARFSCKFGDPAAAAKYLGMMTNDTGAEWQNPGEWQRCHRIAAQARG